MTKLRDCGISDQTLYTNFEKENSAIDKSFVSKKKKACLQYKSDITTLEQYLEDVKLSLFERMENDEVLKNELLDYYDLNESNLPFRIKN